MMCYKRNSVGLLLLFGFLALPGCSTGDLEPTTESPTLALVADLNDVAVGDTVDVEIRVTDVEDLYGVALDVVYPAEVFRFLSCEEGGFLGQDGSETNDAFALESGEEGRLVIGLARVGEVEGVSGEGLVAACRFELVSAYNTAPLRVENPALLESRLLPISFQTEVQDA